MSEPEMRFDACEHPWDVKYVVNGWGVVCTACDPRWAPNPLAGYEAMWAQRDRDVFDRVASYFQAPKEENPA